MSQSFDEIFQNAVKLRREHKKVIKDTITPEELAAIKHQQYIESTFLVNVIHGVFGSKDNAVAR